MQESAWEGSAKNPCSPPYALFTGSMYESGNTNTTPGRSVNMPKQVRNLVRNSFFERKRKKQGYQNYTPLNFSDSCSVMIAWNPWYVVVLQAYIFFLASSKLTQPQTTQRKTKKKKKSKCKLMSVLFSFEQKASVKHPQQAETNLSNALHILNE